MLICVRIERRASPREIRFPFASTHGGVCEQQHASEGWQLNRAIPAAVVDGTLSAHRSLTECRGQLLLVVDRGPRGQRAEGRGTRCGVQAAFSTPL